MANGGASGLSGLLSIFVPYERRRIIIGAGLQYHESELTTEPSDFQYLERRIGCDFRITSQRKRATYVNSEQRVRYELEIVDCKSEFKTALETPGVIAIYSGHSRYGRGACFDQYSGSVAGHGDQWGQGSHADNGLYRLGYPHLAVPMEDIEHHRYMFAPVRVEDPPPSRSSQHPRTCHPHVRGRLIGVELPGELRSYVFSSFRSPSHTYWGVRRGRSGTQIILRAGWENSLNMPFDLGATELRCKTFCHFGCSSRLHFWSIVRRQQYKGWSRPQPPTDRFAYFTTASCNYKTVYWIYYLLTYSERNHSMHWWESHQYAKRRANAQLGDENAGFYIY